jgi:prolyl 4-hydroxylase
MYYSNRYCSLKQPGCKVSSRNQNITLELQVFSLQPKSFYISNLLSSEECDEIIRLAKPTLQRSAIVQSKQQQHSTNDVRTSSNAWLSRYSSPIIDHIYHRMSDLLKIPADLLYPMQNSEDLQVVRYQYLEKYDYHSDWGEHGHKSSRYLTLLLYLNDLPVNSGGETAFPLGDNDSNETDGGFKVHGGKGNALLFYSLLEDGNGDDRSIHASLPIRLEGVEKWVANVWVWDPYFKN